VLEFSALTGFELEAGAHGFKDVVWCETASKCFLVESKTREIVMAIGLPILLIFPEYLVVYL